MESDIRVPKPQEIYRHFRGNLYQIMTIADDSETGEKLVIYQGMYPPYRVWARGLRNFTEKLDPGRYPEAKQVRRFELVEKDDEDEEKLVPNFMSRYRNDEHSKENEDTSVEHHAASDTDAVDEADSVDGEGQLDPMVEKFLDADSTEERLNILMAIHSRITNDMIDTMAVAAGLEIEPGTVDERWSDLRECLLTIGRYEQSRDHFHG
ncbi:MAG: DUF1653 domain-containing protein [Lachnospiraceae bacterium]|jgi:hypothetical protein